MATVLVNLDIVKSDSYDSERKTISDELKQLNQDDTEKVINDFIKTMNPNDLIFVSNNIKNHLAYINKFFSSYKSNLSNNKSNIKQEAVVTVVTYEKLLNRLNSQFKMSPASNKKFVDDLKDQDGNYTAYFFDDQTMNQYENETIKTALETLAMQFNDSGQQINNYELLRTNNIFDEISVEMVFNGTIMKIFLQKKLLELFVKRHFDNHFRDFELNAEFASYISKQESLLNSKMFFRTPPEHFYKFNNDSAMKTFIEANKERQVMKVLKISEKDVEWLKKEDTWSQIYALEIFGENKMKNLFQKSLKKVTVRQRFRNAPNHVVEWFIEFLTKKGEYDNKTDFKSAGDITDRSLKNKNLMREFIKTYQAKHTENVLNIMNNEESENWLTMLDNGNALGDISVDMMFDFELMQKCLNEKISKISLRNFLDKQFPQAKELNSRFVRFLVKSNETLKNYELQPVQFYRLNEDPVMSGFIDRNKKTQIMEALRRLSVQAAQQDFNYFNRTNILQKINVEIMFNPTEMEIFFRKVYAIGCRNAFITVLKDKPEAWGRTPDKCIINPICNSTPKLWSKREIEDTLKKFPTVSRTFDEVDEMIFDLTRDEVGNGRLSFEGDIDCLIAFMKEKNTGSTPWFDIDLLTDDGKRTKKLEEIINDYKRVRV